MFPNNNLNPWLIGGRAGAVAPIRLFTLPYAGGGASAYRAWNKILPPQIDAYAVQLPGRETRYAEPRITQFSAAVEAITEAIRPHLDRPFAIFGHSLGARLAFETTRRLRHLNLPMPKHLFVSSCTAPQINKKRQIYHTLADQDFIEAVTKLGGMPDALLQNDELLELVLPILRADFSLYETYQYMVEPVLHCPITAFGGIEDSEAMPDDVEQWQRQTTQNFRTRLFPGNHFYLNAHTNELLSEIVRDLKHLL